MPEQGDLIGREWSWMGAWQVKYCLQILLGDFVSSVLPSICREYPLMTTLEEGTSFRWCFREGKREEFRAVPSSVILSSAVILGYHVPSLIGIHGIYHLTKHKLSLRFMEHIFQMSCSVPTYQKCSAITQFSLTARTDSECKALLLPLTPRVDFWIRTCWFVCVPWNYYRITPDNVIINLKWNVCPTSILWFLILLFPSLVARRPLRIKMGLCTSSPSYGCLKLRYL